MNTARDLKDHFTDEEKGIMQLRLCEPPPRRYGS
jgi:hypothetical protein